MKSILLSAILLCSTFGIMHAQDLPKPSPLGKVEQRVGLTDITIEYSRPGVKGRTVWGDLVPYGELWRAGANKATQFTTSTDLKIEDKVLKAGTYSLFILPEADGNWTIVWNRETELWGSGDHDPDQDALRVNVRVQDLDHTPERLEFHVVDITNEEGTIAMDWAGKRLAFKVMVNPKEQALKNIDMALAEAEEENKWRVYRNAAGYARDEGMTEEGLDWMQQSLELKDDSWYSYYLHAQLLAQAGRNDEAVKQADKAIELGEADAKEDGSTFSYKKRIEEDKTTWSNGN